MKDSQKTFKLFFLISLLWILFDGILRKWFLFNLSSVLFYVKYVLFGFTYLIYLMNGNSFPSPKRHYQLLIALYIIICGLGLTNLQMNNSIFIAVVGIVIHIFFIPISQITQLFFSKIFHIENLIKWMAYISFPICVLGAIQFYLPVDHPINGFVNDTQLIARAGGFTRISSIFSFVKIYNVYLLFCTTILLPTILNRLSQNKPILLYSLSLLMLVVNMFMTGSRLPLGFMLLYMIFTGIYAYVNFSNLRKMVSVIFVIGFLVSIGLYFTTNAFYDSVNATISRIENAESRHRNEATGFTDLKLRLEDRLDIFKYADHAGWFGYGIGLTYQGNQGSIRHHIPFYFEEEGERLVLELGILGAIIIILMRLFILIYCISLLLRSRDVKIKLLIFALILYLTPSLFTVQMTTFSYMENFFYWFSFGLIIALSKIDMNKQIEE